VNHEVNYHKIFIKFNIRIYYNKYLSWWKKINNLAKWNSKDNNSKVRKVDFYFNFKKVTKETKDSNSHRSSKMIFKLISLKTHSNKLLINKYLIWSNNLKFNNNKINTNFKERINWIFSIHFYQQKLNPFRNNQLKNQQMYNN
jgi:hypothetical protein